MPAGDASGSAPMGVAAILAQDPHSRPATTDRSPAPYKIKRYRCVATRYEKTSTNFLGFVLFAAVRVWLA